MTRYFNILPDGPNACKVLIYGYIGQWDEDVNSRGFVNELAEAEARYAAINVHINSYGGDVFEGIAIFNALRNSGANITIYIDGVAASMAGVVAMCGKPVKMSRYAMIMLHRVSGGAYGDQEDLEQAIGQVKTLEDTLISIVADRCGRKKEDVRSLYFDGKDHWLNAQQALDAGLVDEIIDGPAIKVPEGSMQARQLYGIYNSVLTNTSQKMKNLLVRLGLRAEATEDEAIRKVDELQRTPDAETQKKINDLEAEKTRLTNELAQFRQREKDARTNEIKTVLDAAVADGRIQEPQRKTYEAILEKDFDNGKAVIDSLPKARRLRDELGGQAADDRKDWKWDDYHHKAPEALAAMRTGDPERFKAMYRDKFGKDPS